jgi:2-polyprenyl-6-hydroxyphenyl methylase/3-demethylubiquinone-9 3-methyltransferase
MTKYYSDSLSGTRLKLCYDLAPPRVQQYLNEEINFILERIKPGDFVLELGCGYGRVLNDLISQTDFLIGIDNSLKSLQFGKQTYLKSNKVVLICMDARKLGFHDNEFDVVFCIQNGISALGIEPALLIHEALRITKPNGRLLFSSYSDKFWDDRLKWFQIQASNSLIGEIDYNSTRGGIIICKDGFKATTFNHNQFENLLSEIGNEYKIFEIDESSIFCEIVV